MYQAFSTLRDSEALLGREDRAWIEAIRAGGPSPVDPDGVLLTNVIIQGSSTRPKREDARSR